MILLLRLKQEIDTANMELNAVDGGDFLVLSSLNNKNNSV